MSSFIPWETVVEEPLGDTAEVSSAASPDASPAEVRAWYCIDFSNSIYSTVGLGGFLPLLIQSSAQAAAGFPSQCPNVLNNTTAIALEWPFTPTPVNAYRVLGAGPRACDAPTAPSCFAGLCAGLPATLLDCRDAAGAALVPLRARVGSLSIDPTAFATLCITVSVVAQAFVFLFGTSLGDYGANRKTLLLGASVVGAAACFLCAAISPDNFFAVGLLGTVLSNVSFGVSTICYNSYLPLITAALPDVRALPAGPERVAREEARSAELSSKGFAWGYVAGVMGIVLSIPLVLALPERAAFSGCMLLTGAWWTLFTLPVWRGLGARPGPPLPAGTSYALASLGSLRETGAALWSLPATAYYLALWAFFSDGVFVVGALGGLYASSRVDWGCMGKSVGLLIVFIVVPVSAAFGNVIFLFFSRRFNVSARSALISTLAVIGLVIPVVGLAGLLTTGPAVILLACVYGVSMAPMQSFSRSLFASLIPVGRESAFFGLYEITNRGSSFVGPLMLTISMEVFNDLRLGFIYVAVSVLGSALLLTRFDVGAARAAAACASDVAATLPPSAEGVIGSA